MSAGQPSTGGAEAVLESVAAQAAGQMGAENFPVALRVLPKRPRLQLARLYAFARFVDDVGDRAPGDRIALLDLIEQDVRALPAGASRLAAVRGLRSLVQDTGAPLDPFVDLIAANRMDQHTTRYENFDDLLGYCRLSAAPVGRVVLYIAGVPTAENVADSDAVCAALQVLEHCQDVAEDARAGRIYLPASELRAAGVEDAQLSDPSTSPALRSVLARQVARSEQLLRAGIRLTRRLSGWSRLAVAGFVAGGQATASALRKSDFEVLSRDIRPSGVSTAARAARIMAPW